MTSHHSFIVIVLVILVVGCGGLRHGSVSGPAAQTPLKVELGAPGRPSEPIRILSGQMVAVEIGCPPLELCDANGKVVRELEYTQEPQPLVAPPGEYSIVGYDPGGEKCVARIRITSH